MIILFDIPCQTALAVDAPPALLPAKTGNIFRIILATDTLAPRTNTRQLTPSDLSTTLPLALALSKGTIFARTWPESVDELRAHFLAHPPETLG